MIHTASSPAPSQLAKSPEIRLSDAQMVEKFWRFLPQHIQNAIDAIEQENAQTLKRNLAQLTAGMSAGHGKIIEAMRGVLTDARRIENKAAENMINFRAQVLRGETRPLEFMRTESCGMDLVVDFETMENMGHIYAAQRRRPEMMPFGPESATKVSLPRGRFSADLGDVRIWDEDIGPSPFMTLPHNKIIAIHGHQPQDRSRLPVFFQNPNFFPNGTPKGGEYRSTFFTIEPLTAPRTPAMP